MIDFTYDYSLCDNTANSFHKINPNSKYGKLTLNAVKTRGKGGADLLPATTFGYNIGDEEIKRSSYAYTITPTSFSGESQFEPGDLIETDEPAPRFLGVITQKSGNNYTLANGTIISNITAKIRTTKNPPYNRYAYDYWQMYKSNVRTDLVDKNGNRYRRCDDISSKSTDVWSLRNISGPYGEKIKIQYEPNTYSTNLINESFPFIVTNIDLGGAQWQNNNLSRANITVDIGGYSNISEIVDQGTTGEMMMVLTYSSGSIAGFEDVFSSNFQVNSIVSANVLDVSFSDVQREGGTDIRKRSHWERTWKAFGKTPKQIQQSNNTIASSFVTANVSFLRKNKPYEYGGGIRVKQISVSDLQASHITSYNYALPETNRSSGVITYTPTTLPTLSESFATSNTYTNARTLYLERMYYMMSDLYGYSREIPGPAVFYEYVTVDNKVKNTGDVAEKIKPGKTTYQFEVPNDNMISAQNKFVNTTATRMQKLTTIKKFTAPIGNLLRAIQFDDKGNKITETVNNYLHSGLEHLSDSTFFAAYDARLANFKYQGYVHENFFDYRLQRKVDDNVIHENRYRLSYSSRETYPSIPIGTTVLNYVNGTKTVSENLAFDFYSGAVTRTLNIDANGNRSMAEQTPAYRIYPEMGLKAMDPGRKNMLTQTAAGYVYSVDNSNNKIGIISASINTWSTGVNVLKPDHSIITQDGTNSTNGIVWRPRMTYTWAPEGSTQNGETAIGVFVAFDWANQDNPAAQNASWIKSGETTLYDVYSHALEAADMNDQYAATKMGYNHSRVLVTGGPARYAEIAYSGAEDDAINNTFNGDIRLGNATVNINPDYAHTGVKSAQLSSGTGLQYEVPISKLDNTKDYWASLWIKSATGNAVANAGIFYNNGSSQVNGVLSPSNASGWQLATILIPASAISGAVLTVGGYSNGGAVYLDDIRFHPVNAGISSYVYDNITGELTYILDNNNVSTRFEYDAVGRLTKTYKETLPQGFRPISEILYNYGKVIYQSDAIINQPFTKNDCSGTNVVGSEVYITVPQGQFTSIVSKAHANQQAFNYAQAQANQQGTCNNVYVIVYLENSYPYSGQTYSQTYADVVIRAYSDAAGTIPYYGQVDLVYNETESSYGVDGGMNCDGGNYEITNTYPLSFSGGEYYLGTGKLVYQAKLHPITYDTQCEINWSYSVQQ
ncbi:DUF5977 domain-containing protein [Niabella hibiscisoli]|uniref:DUF5977 domain-containing protein n=1 Tax=Niabella hibiscisoli TaxID=1825928 RepID=UPI001F10D0FB|nr:DUF5977 domain-containing protein [Niabella hibiscisoli]MCH5718199.1 DUF5977 domain-containing protein [Niabella hibiscisoli]